MARSFKRRPGRSGAPVLTPTASAADGPLEASPPTVIGDLPDLDPTPAAAEAEPMMTAVGQTAADAVEAVTEASSVVIRDAAELAQDVSRHGAQVFATTSSETAQAFEHARGRLQQIGVPGPEMGQAAFDQLKSGTDRMARQLSDNYGRTAQAMAEFNAKAVEAWRTNAEAAIAHWQGLAGVTSWSGMIALNTAHARKQIEAMIAQTRELTEIAGRISLETEDGSKPSSEPAVQV